MALSSTTQVIFDTQVATVATLGQWFVDNGYGTAGEGGGSYTSPLTTDGDIFVRSGGADARLAVGASGYVLTSSGTAPQWSASATIGAMTDTWNDGATAFVGIGLDVTDTASASGSFMMRLRRGGSNMFTVAKDGGVFSNSGYTAQTGGFVGGGEIRVRSDGCFAISDTSQYNVAAAKDTSLWRISAGVWGVRGASTSAAGAINFLNRSSAPANPPADTLNVYADFDGSNKAQLIIQKPDGTALVAYQEP